MEAQPNLFPPALCCFISGLCCGTCAGLASRRSVLSAVADGAARSCPGGQLRRTSEEKPTEEGIVASPVGCPVANSWANCLTLIPPTFLVEFPCYFPSIIFRTFST